MRKSLSPTREGGARAEPGTTTTATITRAGSLARAKSPRRKAVGPETVPLRVEPTVDETIALLETKGNEAQRSPNPETFRDWGEAIGNAAQRLSSTESRLPETTIDELRAKIEAQAEGFLSMSTARVELAKITDGQILAWLRAVPDSWPDIAWNDLLAWEKSLQSAYMELADAKTALNELAATVQIFLREDVKGSRELSSRITSATNRVTQVQTGLRRTATGILGLSMMALFRIEQGAKQSMTRLQAQMALARNSASASEATMRDLETAFEAAYAELIRAKTSLATFTEMTGTTPWKELYHQHHQTWRIGVVRNNIGQMEKEIRATALGILTIAREFAEVNEGAVLEAMTLGEQNRAQPAQMLRADTHDGPKANDLAMSSLQMVTTILQRMTERIRERFLLATSVISSR